MVHLAIRRNKNTSLRSALFILKDKIIEQVLNFTFQKNNRVRLNSIFYFSSWSRVRKKHTCTTSSNSLKSKLFTNFYPWSRVSALPRRPAAYKAAALLTELTRRTISTVLFYHEFRIFTTL